MKEQPPFYKTGTSRSPFYQEISGKENRQIKKAVKKVTKGRKKWNQAEEILSIGGDGKVKSSPETPRDERKLKVSTRKTQKGRAGGGRSDRRPRAHLAARCRCCCQVQRFTCNHSGR